MTRMTPLSTAPLPAVGAWRFPTWAPLAALILALVLAWANFATTARWAEQPGALHGWRRPFYVASLLLVSILCVVLRRRAASSVVLTQEAIPEATESDFDITFFYRSRDKDLKVRRVDFAFYKSGQLTFR